MKMKAPVWRGITWPWRSGEDDEGVRQARRSVAGLAPAVIITGGSRGIGYALAQRFLEKGHRAVIVARNADQLATAAATLKTIGDVETIACDASDPDAWQVISAALDEKKLYADVLVNCAAMGIGDPFADNDPEALSRLVALNVATVTRLTRTALPAMLARRQGGIINVASLGGAVPGPNQAAYYASKAYVLSLTEAIASEVAGQGVRISTLLPGPVDTRFHHRMGAQRSLYRLVLPSMTASRVARSAYRGFWLGNRVIVPGIINTFFYISLRLLPHVVSVPMMAWLLRRPQD
jgi:uncharacterized protein